MRALLEPLLSIELVPSGVSWPPAWLVAPPNEPFVRGAAWALVDVDEPWVVGLLGRLALRGAAPSPHPKVTTALCHAVASGAIEALAQIGTPAAQAELRTLLGEVRRRDLLRRVATVLGEPLEATLARDDRVRREKRRLAHATADPEPKERQRVAREFVRGRLAPMLRDAGFDDAAGQTFWRRLDDRVERLHAKAHKGGLTLELGIWFRFVPRPYEVPERDGRERPGELSCDLRGNVHAWSGDLESAGRESALWFVRWRSLAVVLRWLREGAPSDEVFGFGAPGSPHHHVLTGYVARAPRWKNGKKLNRLEREKFQLSLAAAPS